jgi:phage I-like protein
LNDTELARNKFNALFAAHDAKDQRAAAEEQRPASKTTKKEIGKNVDPQSALTRREVLTIWYR